MFRSLMRDLERKIMEISGKDFHPAFFSFENLLVVLSKFYQAGGRLRLAMFGLGVLKQKKLPCAVVSIGNITAGGSGKTPMAVYLAESLIERGYRPVVVSRGYKGRLGKAAGVVGDGERLFMDARTAGDEPFMMARMKRFPVVVGKRRYAAGKLAMETFDPDMIILDDGFQHLALARDADLVLFDHDSPLGNGRMLPAGRLREAPEMARKRIHCLILTRCPDLPGGEQLPPSLRAEFPGIPFFCTRHLPCLSGIYPGTLKKKEVLRDLSALKERRVVLFSGIAKNYSFRETVEGLGAKVAAHLEFQDHYRYKKEDFKEIQTRAADLDADMILTTEKDWVKLDPSITWAIDLGVIGIRIKFDHIDTLVELIESKCIR